MLVSNHITLLQSVKLSETDVVAAGVRTRPLRCFAIRVLSSDSCCLRNVIVDIKCQRSGYHRPGPGGRRKVRWRSSSPLRGSPLTRPRMAMPFDRPPASWLFAPRISDTNKWCKSTSRKRQEAELRTRIAKHLSGRVRPPDASKPTDHRPRPPSHANNHYLRPQSRTSVRI